MSTWEDHFKQNIQMGNPQGRGQCIDFFCVLHKKMQHL